MTIAAEVDAAEITDVDGYLGLSPEQRYNVASQHFPPWLLLEPIEFPLTIRLTAGGAVSTDVKAPLRRRTLSTYATAIGGSYSLSRTRPVWRNFFKALNRFRHIDTGGP